MKFEKRGTINRAERKGRIIPSASSTKMPFRAQTAIEYIMLVGMVIFFVIIVYMAVRTNILDSMGQVFSKSTDGIFGMLRGGK